MSEQEKAIFEMENHIWQSWEHGYPIQMTDKSTDVIIKALQKQIPIKPIGKDDMYTCGGCDAHVAKDYYCWNCGQKLDWEVTE